MTKTFLIQSICMKSYFIKGHFSTFIFKNQHLFKSNFNYVKMISMTYVLMDTFIPILFMKDRVVNFCIMIVFLHALLPSVQNGKNLSIPQNHRKKPKLRNSNTPKMYVLLLVKSIICTY